MTRNPAAPAEYDDEVIAAIKALARGNASPGQQIAALKWIVEDAAIAYDETFVAGAADTTNYRSGRRSVGLQIIKLTKLKTSSEKANG